MIPLSNATQTATKVKEQFKHAKLAAGIIKKSSDLRCLVFNAHSMCNKIPELMEPLVDNSADIVFLTETWLKSRKNAIGLVDQRCRWISWHSGQSGAPS